MLAALPVGSLIALLAFGVALLLVLILRFKLQAFLALILVSLVVAMSSKLVNPDGVSLALVAQTIVDSMGSALGLLALIIGMGAIFGAILEHSGGMQSLATSLVKVSGKEKASWAMLVTGFVISIPVFLDVALVMLAPLLYALARDTKKSLLVFGMPLVVGMAVTHAFVPPTPGPVAVAYMLNVNLGWVIGFGLLIGIPTALICGPWVTGRIVRNVKVVLPEISSDEPKKELNLPGVGWVLFLVGLPIGLILLGTVVEQVVAAGLESGLAHGERKAALTQALADANLWYQFLFFLGHPVVALMLSTLLALYFLGSRRGVDRATLLSISTNALGPAGIIILITGAGGVFKGVLDATGIADALKMAFQDASIPLLILAYVLAVLIRVAQGSATVAMVAAAGLMAGFASDLSQPQLALITICIAAGATGFSHVNDSGFWMISRYLRMSEAQTLRTWTVASTMISVVGFGLALLLSLFV